jgi:hypothetical protein
MKVNNGRRIKKFKKMICMLQIILRKLLKKFVDIHLIQGISNLEEIISDDIKYFAIALE